MAAEEKPMLQQEVARTPSPSIPKHYEEILPELPISKSERSSLKKRRQRVNKEQLDVLEQYFTRDRMPSQQIRMELAKQLGMSTRRVQIWFQNKRAKLKRIANTKGSDSESENKMSGYNSDNNKPRRINIGILPFESKFGRNNDLNMLLKS